MSSNILAYLVQWLASLFTSTAKQDATNGIAFSASLGSLRGDGEPDLAVPNEGSDEVSVLLNMTAPEKTTISFPVTQDLSAARDSDSMSLGKLNGDGKPDLAVPSEGPNTVSVLLNSTTLREQNEDGGPVATSEGTRP